MKHRYQNFVRAFFLFCASAVLVTCADSPVAKIGDNVSGPYAIVKAHGGTGFYVLNSSASTQYNDGSVSWYEVDDQGNSTHKASTSIPRLATRMAISADSKVMAIITLGSKSAIRFYDVQSPGVLTQRGGDVPLPAGGTLDQLRFFNPTGAAAGEYYFMGTTLRETSLAEVHVYKIAAATELVFSLPADLPDMALPSYNIGFGTPVFLPDQNLLVAFPNTPSKHVLPALLNANFENHSAAVGTWTPIRIDEKDKRFIDIRGGSILVVDFDKYFASASTNPKIKLADAHAYAPFAMIDKSFTQPTAAVPVSNSEIHFHNRSQYAKSVLEGGCYEGKTEAEQPLPRDTVLLVDDFPDGSTNFGNVVRINQWADLKAGVAQVISAFSVGEALDKFDYTKRLVYLKLKTELYAKTTEEPLDQNRVTDMSVAEIDGKCVPVWPRARLSRGGTLYYPGLEPGALQMRGNSAQEILAAGIPRGSVGVAAFKNVAFFVTYAFDSVSSVKYSDFK